MPKNPAPAKRGTKIPSEEQNGQAALSVYKTFSKLNNNWKSIGLNFYQPGGLAEFREREWTIDRIRLLNEGREKSSQYVQPLWITFMHYEKAFDWVSPAAVLEPLRVWGIHETYIRFLNDVYKVFTSRRILPSQAMSSQSIRKYDRWIPSRRKCTELNWREYSENVTGKTGDYGTTENTWSIWCGKRHRLCEWVGRIVEPIAWEAIIKKNIAMRQKGI